MTTISTLYENIKGAMALLAPADDPQQYALCGSFESLAESGNIRAYTVTLSRGAVDGNRAWHGVAGREDDFLNVDLYFKTVNQGTGLPQSDFEMTVLADERRRVWQTVRDYVQAQGQHVGLISFEGGELEQDGEEPSIYFNVLHFRVEYDDDIVSNL